MKRMRLQRTYKHYKNIIKIKYRNRFIIINGIKIKYPLSIDYYNKIENSEKYKNYYTIIINDIEINIWSNNVDYMISDILSIEKMIFNEKERTKNII